MLIIVVKASVSVEVDHKESGVQQSEAVANGR